MIAESDGSQVADLPAIETPVMLLVGTKEPFAEQAREAAALLSRGAVVPLEGLDHVQTFFRSDLVLPHVREFLAQTNT
jgi:pimeloyl-ACP methyl ester carboxylesterase